MNAVGIISGLATALLWTATAVCFELSSRRLGSWTVNVLRLVLAMVLFLSLSMVRSHALLPVGLTWPMWRDLLLSGLIGFVVGDLLLFEAFVRVGARMSMLIYASVPAMTAIGGFFWLGERMVLGKVLGMGVTVLGIALAVTAKGRQPSALAVPSHGRWGITLAIGGAVGQAAGLLLAKHGASGLDSFSATSVRVLAGVSGFSALALISGKGKVILSTLMRAFARQRGVESENAKVVPQLRRALGLMALGSVLGPFLGVSLGLHSMQLLPAGVASTLMSIVPVLLVPVSAVLFKERVGGREWLGTTVALLGVSVLAFAK
ncbi:MAG: DMT family transporter [Polyangiaceae bacterium]